MVLDKLIFLLVMPPLLSGQQLNIAQDIFCCMTQIFTNITVSLLYYLSMIVLKRFDYISILNFLHIYICIFIEYERKQYLRFSWKKLTIRHLRSIPVFSPTVAQNHAYDSTTHASSRLNDFKKLICKLCLYNTTFKWESSILNFQVRSSNGIQIWPAPETPPILKIRLVKCFTKSFLSNGLSPEGPPET